MKRFAAPFCLLLFLAGRAEAQLKVEDDAGRLAPGAKLETLWEEGGFTEGAAAGPKGDVYFSDFAQPFNARPADPRVSFTANWMSPDWR